MNFEPERDTDLARRYGTAVVEICDGTWRPGQYRRHVLDFHNGLRLIISRENFREICKVNTDVPKLPDEEMDVPQIHVSASVQPGYPLFRKIANMPLEKRKQWFFEFVPKICASLFGLRKLRLVFVSAGDVPHFLQPGE